jgi:MFS family permease
MVSGLNYPIINGYINKRVESSTRSTVMSIASFMFTGILTVVEVAAGWVATYWGLKTSLLILALGTAPISIYLLTLWNRELDKENSARVRYQRVLKDVT